MFELFGQYRSRAMNYWLVKSEPESYSWDDLVREKRTAWTGVRNFQAQKNLRAMKRGDLVLFYHSVSQKAVVGIARVVEEAYRDPTAKEGDWQCVDLAPEKPLANAVMLAQIKADKSLAEMKLVRQGRLSVTPVTAAEFKRMLKLAGGSDRSS